ncbi:MAG TPA: RNA-binding domain-containing protein [Kribbella sp.]
MDLKLELPAGKATLNADLAKDLASFAVDCGLLVIGVEDHNGHAGAVRGVELAGLADRVDQIARDKVRPSVVVRSHEVYDPDRAGWGCLLVHVPPSAQAPHMVDYVYYGRGDKANMRLADEQVRLILDQRSRQRADITAELLRMAEDDPIPESQRKAGHIYLLAHPVAASEEAFVDLLGRDDTGQVVNDILDEIASARTERIDSELRQLPHRVPRAEGQAFTDVYDGSRIYEPSMLDLLVREDGGIRLICGRGTDIIGGQSAVQQPPPQMVIPMVLLSLTHGFLAFAGRLGGEHGAYQGQWQLGIRLDRLNKVVPADKVVLTPGQGRVGHPYTRSEYVRTTIATTEELVNAPQRVAERLLAPLLRAMGVATKYIPYVA